jgi:hypothetical protein
MWSAATATYFAFRDDVLTRLIARQAEMQYAYEDRCRAARGSTAPPAASCSIGSSSTEARPHHEAPDRAGSTPPRSAPFGQRGDRGSIRPPARGRCGSARLRHSGNPLPSATP